MQIESFLKKSKRKKHKVVTLKTPAPLNNRSELTNEKVSYTPKTYRSWDYLQQNNNNPSFNYELKGTQKVHDGELKGTQKVHDGELKGTQKVHDGELKGTQKVHDDELKGTQKVHDGELKGTQKVHDDELKGTQKVHDGELKGTQKVHDDELKGTQKVHDDELKGTQKVHDGELKGTQKVHDGELKGTQKVHDDELKGTQKSPSFSTLYGVQKKILLYLYHSSKPFNFKHTEQLTNTDISYLSAVNISSIKTSLQRLKAKNCISVKEVQKGRSGWTKYSIKNSLIKEISNISIYNSNNINTNITIKKENEENYNTKKTTNQNTKTNSRSTFISNNSQKPTNSLVIQNANVISKSELTNKTNEKLKYEELPEEWKNINYHFLDDLHFKQHHIVGLYKLDVLEPEVVQESIEHFAYGIKHNPDNYKKYTDPLKVFYGSLRKGKPWTESTYKSTKEIATDDLIQRRKTEKRKIANEICKLVESMEKESYEKWHFLLSEEEKNEIKEKHKLQESGIFNVFDEKIYKLHYGKYVMEEHKDPSELALEEFIAKKKRKEEAEAKRIKKMLQEGGMIKEYYKWAGELKEKEIQAITEEEGGMTEKGQNKMIIYYAKKIVI